MKLGGGIPDGTALRPAWLWPPREGWWFYCVPRWIDGEFSVERFPVTVAEYCNLHKGRGSLHGLLQ